MIAIWAVTSSSAVARNTLIRLSAIFVGKFNEVHSFANPSSTFPKWEFLKDKSWKSGKFLEPEKWPSTYQLSPAIHPKFTIIKIPCPAARFDQSADLRSSNL